MAHYNLMNESIYEMQPNYNQYLFTINKWPGTLLCPWHVLHFIILKEMVSNLHLTDKETV